MRCPDPSLQTLREASKLSKQGCRAAGWQDRDSQQAQSGPIPSPPCGPCPHITVCKPHLERHPQSQGQAWVSTALICDIPEARILTHLLSPRPPAQGSTDGAPEIILMKPSWSPKASANPLLPRVPTPGRSKASILKGDDLTPSHL